MKHPVFAILLVLFCLFSLISILATVYDKLAARRNGRRISEKCLMGLAAAGGAGCMWIAMMLIRHKTRHKKFMILLPILFILQIGLLFLSRLI